MYNPEYKGRYKEPYKNLDVFVENVVKDAAITTIYGIYLVFHPRTVLKSLRTEGLKEISASYKEFLKNTRDMLN